MKRALLAIAIVLGAASCAGAGDSPYMSMGLSLSAETAAKVRTLQVEFVRPGTIDCGRAASACLNSLGVDTVPLAGTAQGKKAFVTPLAAGTTSSDFAVQIDAGTYLVNVEALDGSGNLVANGCHLGVELDAGVTTEVDITLAEYTGAACNAAL